MLTHLNRLRTRLTSAHLIALLALFVALGGTSYAAVKITNGQLTNNSISGAKLANGSIPSTKLRNNSIPGFKLRNGAVSSAKLASGLLMSNGSGGSTLSAQSGTGGTSGASGARGPQGPTGQRGLTGSAGKDGANGKDGSAGATGASGPSDLAQVVEPGTLDVDGAGTVTAPCPNAHPVALGGNYNAGAAPTVVAHLTTGSYGITVTGGPTLGSVTVYALCGGSPSTTP